MHDELTPDDIRKMESELKERRTVLRPRLLEDVKTARAFGDLSENFEYKEAKRARGKNESRIRYLEGMIKTAVVISGNAPAGGIGLYDRVEVRETDGGESETYQLVTTLRQNALEGLISKESPMGRALMGRRAGQTVTVELENGGSYQVVILKVDKAGGESDIPISSY